MAEDELLHFAADKAESLGRHLPRLGSSTAGTPTLPWVTVTYAASVDSAISLAPGTRTVLSGPESKAMTHYLRSQHEAICIGVGTAVADDPGLNCRLGVGGGGGGVGAATDADAGAGAGADAGSGSVSGSVSGLVPARQPRPVIVDPNLRWPFSAESKVMRLARAGRGLAPYVVAARGRAPRAHQNALLESLGGKYLFVESDPASDGRLAWRDILMAVGAEGLASIMIEGGAEVISSLLEPRHADLVRSVIVTIAPTWLGRGSVAVCPPRRVAADGRPVPAARLTKTAWIPLGEDVVLCGQLLT